MRGNSLPVHTGVHVGEMRAAIVGPHTCMVEVAGEHLNFAHVC